MILGAVHLIELWLQSESVYQSIGRQIAAKLYVRYAHSGCCDNSNVADLAVAACVELQVYRALKGDDGDSHGYSRPWQGAGFC